jgi:hypothetical protein
MFKIFNYSIKQMNLNDSLLQIPDRLPYKIQLPQNIYINYLLSFDQSISCSILELGMEGHCYVPY